MSDSPGSENFSGSVSTRAARHSFGNPNPMVSPSFENARKTIRPTRNLIRPRTNASPLLGSVAANAHTSSTVTGTASGGGASRRADLLDALEARRGPQRLHVVEHIERRHRLGQRDPGQLRRGEDVDVGRDGRRLIERPAPDEEHVRVRVLAVDGDLTGRAAEDALRAAVVAGHIDRLWLAHEQLDAVGLDQQVDDERAAGLPLAVEAVAAMDEERLGREPVANGA